MTGFTEQDIIDEIMGMEGVFKGYEAEFSEIAEMVGNADDEDFDAETDGQGVLTIEVSKMVSHLDRLESLLEALVNLRKMNENATIDVQDKGNE
jgi:hypothetical protein